MPWSFHARKKNNLDGCVKNFEHDFPSQSCSNFDTPKARGTIETIGLSPGVQVLESGVTDARSVIQELQSIVPYVPLFCRMLAINPARARHTDI